MTEAPIRKKPWFGLITDSVLARSGPGKNTLQGADLTRGEPNPLPINSESVDVYSRADAQVGKPRQ